MDTEKLNWIIVIILALSLFIISLMLYMVLPGYPGESIVCRPISLVRCTRGLLPINLRYGCRVNFFVSYSAIITNDLEYISMNSIWGGS